jgi:hypothetical protein
VVFLFVDTATGRKSHKITIMAEKMGLSPKARRAKIGSTERYRCLLLFIQRLYRESQRDFQPI